ncbi:hypothetical protein SAMN05421847_0745 [Halpernia humi]|uniref:Uncharacterized protein n=1 Tax=Halpernia humi TaxID=493375 RepID=A0A1H5UEU4_9FLAO|nr:hypothetical protein [Halpernia humi]SEF72817.1 hypothetical protein SAMN05421847_0745 [Halpernia humi]
MKTIYKVFLALFIIFIAANLYVFDWSISFFAEENSTFVLSMAAGLLGIFVVFVLHTWSKLSTAKG